MKRCCNFQRKQKKDAVIAALRFRFTTRYGICSGGSAGILFNEVDFNTTNRGSIYEAITAFNFVKFNLSQAENANWGWFLQLFSRCKVKKFWNHEYVGEVGFSYCIKIFFF